MNISLSEKIVLVTGGARGVGRGIARVMGNAGARVVILDMDEEMSRESVDILISEGIDVAYRYLDLMKHESFEGLLSEILADYGRIDVLVNNAGIVNENGFLDTSYDELRRVFEINYFGGYLLSQIAVKKMIELQIRGSILFTSSTHQQVTMLRPAYSCSKASVGMLVKEMALELTPSYGIRVNAVAPGVVAVHGQEDISSEIVPIGNLATPEDIGKSMVFLASDVASHITGHTLVVDGAFSIAHTHYWMKQEKL
jgi:NAD(P)-dependent dehydrogenase (short-subunit alcohol dehydrogenase family)